MKQQRRLKAYDRARNALKLGPMTAKQLSEVLHLCVYTVHRIMSELLEAGEVYRTTDRAYAMGRAYYVFHLMEVGREEA